jgi:hypothetical protein
MQLNLNIYSGKTVEKVYTADEFDIMFGTVEDLVSLVDVDRLSGNVTDTDFIGAVAVLLKGGFGQVKTLLKELFPDVTDEELKHTKMKEVLAILVQVLKHGFSEMAAAGNTKN